MITRSLIFLFFLLFASGCNSEKAADKKNAVDGPEGAIGLTKEQFKSSGMTFSELKKISASEKIEATGQILVKPESYFMMSTLMQGRVKEVFVTRGDWVKAGQALVEIEDPSIIRLQQDYLEVVAGEPVLKADFERQKSLFADEVASEKKLQKARADYLSVKAKVTGLKEQLRLLGLDPVEVEQGKIKSSVVLKAPIDGNVSTMEINKGVYLEEGAEVLEIIDPSGIFVSLSVFENDVTGIKAGLKVLVKPAGDATARDTALITRIARKVEEGSRSVTVHAAFEKDAFDFIPGMYLDAQIVKGVGEMFVLPEEAVVDLENRNWVLLKLEEKNESYIMVQREVEVLDLDNGLVAILNNDDFSADDQFLCKGAFGLIQ
ncbi:efflux RND transporter periplasmic adaptor subunit [Marinilabilia rubra]|uniref:CzcB-like barrel-sandwich hybrid domain-containing protein n=1 Tax=Marinilabilia rubra TaxID=2162893 RepID=A0A2U2B7W8_9BACT|nr:efflux RND transporter periplasmic adaptor subunit [Marinilabilia rubra]PWD99157.1 hypothetical protein DDZ16_11200 [Marinilabilia rubra]